MLNFAFQGAGSPSCVAACDFNGDGGVDITNAVYLFNALFQGGPAVPSPSGECGVSGSDGDEKLGCEASESCN